MITFNASELKTRNCYLNVNYIIDNLVDTDLSLEDTATCICLNSTNSNICQALLAAGNITLVIDPTNDKKPIHLERVFEDEEGELQIEELVIHDMTKKDIEKLLDFEQSYYEYRKLMTA